MRSAMSRSSSLLVLTLAPVQGFAAVEGTWARVGSRPMIGHEAIDRESWSARFCRNGAEAGP